MPKSWKKSNLIPIFKEKNHIVMQMEHGIKLIERQFEEQLRNVVKLEKCQ